ncbi:MAG: DUF2834 domain-containing protein [Thermodesulfobacteriota bacterium]|nr:DUF2834 domain-containing protein [Thermodesulfobacteriota bacterium]
MWYFAYSESFFRTLSLSPFIVENGFDVGLFIDQLFANKVSSFFVCDVIVSVVVLLFFMFSEGIYLGYRKLCILFSLPSPWVCRLAYLSFCI